MITEIEKVYLQSLAKDLEEAEALDHEFDRCLERILDILTGEFEELSSISEARNGKRVLTIRYSETNNEYLLIVKTE